MPEEKNAPAPGTGATGGEGIDDRYVGFCDILGFSNRILSDFAGTLEIYKRFGDTISGFSFKEVEVTMYSDAVLITGNSLGPVSSAIQSLWFFALASDLMIRGAITKGRYWEQRRSSHVLVASDA